MDNNSHILTSLFSDIESIAASLHDQKRNEQEIGFLHFACDFFSIQISDLTVSNVAKVLERYLEVQDKKIKLSAYRNASKREDAEELIELLRIYKKNWNEACFQSKFQFVANQHAEIQAVLKRRKTILGDSFTMQEFFVPTASLLKDAKNSAVKISGIDPFDVAYHDVPLWAVRKTGSTYSEIDCIILFVASGEIMMSRWGDDDSKKIDAWSAVDFNGYVYTADKVFFFLQKKDALEKISSMIEPSSTAVKVWMAFNRLHQLHADWESECIGTTR